MKNRAILKLHCVLILVCSFVEVQAQVDSNPPASGNIELAMIDVDMVKNFVLVTFPDGRMEESEIKPEGGGLKNLASKESQVLIVFQRMYDEGWAIESALYHNDYNRVVYIIKRRKQ